MLKARCKFGPTWMHARASHTPSSSRVEESVYIYIYVCVADIYLYIYIYIYREIHGRYGRRRAARKVLGAHDCDNAKRNIAAKFIGRSSNGTRSEPCEK